MAVVNVEIDIISRIAESPIGRVSQQVQ